MMLLETNVLSSLMSGKPPPPVARFITAQPMPMLFTAAVCQAEILAGIAVLPEGKRRATLDEAARAMFLEDFDERILPFDGRAAEAYAELYAMRRRAGRPASTIDLMVAATARCHGASVVTRDTGGFEGCGLTVINPWTALGESRA